MPSASKLFGENSPAAFQGAWQDDEGMALEIKGTTMHGVDGSCVELSIKGKDTCSFSVSGETFEGKLSEDRKKIQWSDGGEWIRTDEPPALPSDASEEKAVSKKEAPKEEVQVKDVGIIKMKNGKPDLQLEQALALQKDLYEAFTEEEFQRKLDDLEKIKDQRNFLMERSTLFLSVQNKILPRYGFALGQRGVYDMLGISQKFKGNKDFEENRLMLNQILGLEKAGAAEDARGAGGRPGEARTRPAVDVEDEAPKQRLPNVDINCKHAFDATEIKVSVPGDATFVEVKEAISRHLGRGDIVKGGRLVRKNKGVYSAFKDSNTINEVREVIVLGAVLEVFDDEEAKAWGKELEERIAERLQKEREQRAAARARQDRHSRSQDVSFKKSGRSA